uniref:Diacylglycerol kinase accessory domain-containing protein n=1 Tax=Acanthochromis polyacanthus TaxID=80966 RepID=A0A3Q1F9B0_9TELE
PADAPWSFQWWTNRTDTRSLNVLLRSPQCDGVPMSLPSLQGLAVLNIPSYAGGINFWGGTKEDNVRIFSSGRRGLDPAARHRQDRPQEPSPDAHKRQSKTRQ